MPTEEDQQCPDLWIPSDQIVADRQKVAEFCASEIRCESRRLASETYPGKRREGRDGSDIDADNEKPLSALDLFRASVGFTLQIAEQMKEADARDIDAYCAADEGASRLVPLIKSAPRLPREQRRAIMTREMARHIQRTRVAPKLYGAETVISPALDGEAIRQDITQRVQELVWRQKAKAQTIAQSTVMETNEKNP